jgi:hypothetical protein
MLVQTNLPHLIVIKPKKENKKEKHEFIKPHYQPETSRKIGHHHQSSCLRLLLRGGSSTGGAPPTPASSINPLNTSFQFFFPSTTSCTPLAIFSTSSPPPSPFSSFLFFAQSPTLKPPIQPLPLNAPFGDWSIGRPCSSNRGGNSSISSASSSDSSGEVCWLRRRCFATWWSRFGRSEVGSESRLRRRLWWRWRESSGEEEASSSLSEKVGGS